jgi:nucleoside-diphosphate-sugar epimerase
MPTLVTGSSGFVGRHLVEALADAVPLSRADADLRHELPALPSVDTVIHAAATIDGDRDELLAVNAEGTRRLAEWARANGVRTFVFISTGGIELDTPYAESKRAAETHVRDAAPNTHVVRLFFPYGAGQGARRLVPRLLDAVSSGRAIEVADDGGPKLSMTYIDDVVEAIRRLAYLPGSETVDLGGEAVSMRAIAEAIGRVTGNAPVLERRESAAHDLVADTSRLAALTGFTPRISFEEGVARTWR